MTEDLESNFVEDFVITTIYHGTTGGVVQVDGVVTVCTSIFEGHVNLIMSCILSFTYLNYFLLNVSFIVFPELYLKQFICCSGHGDGDALSSFVQVHSVWRTICGQKFFIKTFLLIEFIALYRYRYIDLVDCCLGDCSGHLRLGDWHHVGVLSSGHHGGKSEDGGGPPW